MPSPIAPTAPSGSVTNTVARTSSQPRPAGAGTPPSVGTGRTPASRANAGRVINGGATPGISLPAGRGGVTTGAAGATNPPATGSAGDTKTSATDQAKKILDDIKSFSAYRKQLKDVGDILANTGNLGVQAGEKILEGAKKVLEFTKDLWKKGFWGKVGAIFTGLATGLLYALGGLVFGLGKLLSWLAWPLQKLAGSTKGDAEKKTNQQKKALDKKAGDAKKGAKAKLDALKTKSKTEQRQVLAELARQAGMTGGQALSPEQRERAVALLQVSREAGVSFPNVTSSLADRFPVAERRDVAALLPGSVGGAKAA